MIEVTLPRVAAEENADSHPCARRRHARSARVALAAATIAATGLLGAVSANAGSGGAAFSGGLSGSDTTATGGSACAASELGSRTLEAGDCGEDVRTLNWILKSKRYAGVALAAEFGPSTEDAVREFERSAGLDSNGVVEPATHAALAKSLPSEIATWYGPGLYGNNVACGGKLTRDTVGVAHKTLPCGSKVVVRYEGNYLRTTVIDRGPFANNAQWDLTEAAADELGFGDAGVDEVQVAKLGRAKRK